MHHRGKGLRGWNNFLEQSICTVCFAATKRYKQGRFSVVGGLPVQQLSHVVLDRQGVTGIQDQQDLAGLCPRVKEMHRPFNQITHCRDVSQNEWHAISQNPMTYDLFG